MSINKKKVAKSTAAVAIAAALLLSGTFAWQSISQTALNEASDVVNPGGRLHDDFNGENKDVYVENFADDAIYARIRLDEYFEIIQKGTSEEIIHSIAGERDADTGEIISWATHYFDSANATDEYWEWSTGGSTTYMPTFNMNKDSLVADINGTYNGLDGVVIDDDDDDRYTDYAEYADGETKTDNEIYDADTDGIDDVGEDFENLSTYIDAGNIVTVSEEHTAQSTLDATLMSMQEWIDAGSQPGEYWVYDTDGWVYWAQAIEPDTATGLLLDGIELAQVMDDSWYYAINVVAQFITADDLGKTDGTGFYNTSEGSASTDDALALLDAIGVDVPVSEEEGIEDGITISGTPIIHIYGYGEEGVATSQLSATVVADGEVVENPDINWSYSVTNDNDWYEVSYDIDETGLVKVDYCDYSYMGFWAYEVMTVTADYEGMTDTYSIVVSEYTPYLKISLEQTLYEDTSESFWYPTLDGAVVDTDYNFNSTASFNGDLVDCLEYEWSVQDFDGNEVTTASIDENGIFNASQPGEYTVVAKIKGYDSVSKTQKIKVHEAHLDQIRTNTVVGASGEAKDMTSLTYDDYIIIDAETYVVVARDDEKALLMYADKDQKTTGLSLPYTTPEGNSSYVSYYKYGDTASWKNSNIIKFLNSDEKPYEVLNCGNSSLDFTKGELTTAEGYLSYNPTIAELAMDTTVKTRVYTGSDYTYEETTSKVFLLSEADVNGTVGGEPATVDDYTYVVDGNGVQLFNGVINQTDSVTSGNIYPVNKSLLRTTSSDEEVSYVLPYSGVGEHHLENGCSDTYPGSDSSYTYYWSQIVPAFWVSLT